MKVPRLLRLLFALALLLLTVRNGVADTTLSAMEAAYTAAVAKIEQPQHDLLGKYREGLRSLAERKRAAGDLEGVITVNRELESADKREKRDLGAHPDLERLREIYDTTLAQLKSDAAGEHARLIDAYRTRLAATVESLTREGKIDEAVAVNARIKELDAAAPLRAAESGANVVWEWRSRADVEAIGDCEVKTDLNGFILSSERRGGGSWMQSRREFKPPFRIAARVATDSTNIRFYFSGPLVIFNWEMNTAELRLQHPATGVKAGVRDMGQLELNKMHDIVIDVLLDKIQVSVDGEIRGALLGTPSDNTAGLEAPIAIGPAFGSVVTVESLRVIKLE